MIKIKINIAIEYTTEVPDNMTDDEIENLVKKFVMNKTDESDDYAWRDYNDDSCCLYGSIY